MSSLPTHLRDLDVSKFFCSMAPDKKDASKKVIKLHPFPGRRTNIACQLGDDGMVDQEGQPAPIVPLKGPGSYENSQPDKPSVFCRLADVNTAAVLQAIDELLPREMERLGLVTAKDYRPENYRPLYNPPDPEAGGMAGAINIKFDKRSCPVKCMELEDPDDDESEEITRNGSLDEIQPGAVEAMYMRISISSIWKVKRDWGATIWCNKLVSRMGVANDGLIVGNKIVRGDMVKEIKHGSRSAPKASSSEKRSRPAPPKASSKRIKNESSDEGSDGEEGDDFSTAPVANRTEAPEPVEDASDAGSASEGEAEEEVASGDETGSNAEEEDEEEEHVPTPPRRPSKSSSRRHK